MSRGIVALFALIILAFGGVYVLQAGLAAAGDTHTVTNESWTPDAGNVTTLDESNRVGAYYDNETDVYDENGTEMDSGTDYEWYDGNGTVKTLSGGELENDSSATISYTFEQTTESQRQLTAMMGLVPEYMGLVFPAVIAIIFLMLLRGG